MKTIIIFLWRAIWIVPYTICWWSTYVFGFIMYGPRRAMPVEPIIGEFDLRAVPLKMTK